MWKNVGGENGMSNLLSARGKFRVASVVPYAFHECNLRPTAYFTIKNYDQGPGLFWVA